MQEKEQQEEEQIDLLEPAGFYGRFSDDQSRKTSIEDQHRICQLDAHTIGADIQFVFSDEGKTGRTLFFRPGFAECRTAYKQKKPPFRILFVDETARLSRKEADMFTIIDELAFWGIRVRFSSDDLDSNNSGFRDAIAAKARQDAQFSKTHGNRVRRGRLGQFERGLNPGWTSYGYRNERVDSADKDARGHAMSAGMVEKIDSEEAEIVVLIFTWYVEGLSPRQIAARLNKEGVRPPRMSGKKKKGWSRATIAYILHNQKYVGILISNRTTQERNPDTGKMVVRVKPESQWRKKVNPDLRIVNSELWDKAVAERERRDKWGKTRSGGSNRTERSRTHFLSTLLECACGAKYHLRSNDRYVCRGYEEGGTCCKNDVTLRREEIERALISALCDNLRCPELRESLVGSLFDHLKTARPEGEGDRATARKAQLDADREVEQRNRDNLLEAIKMGRDLRSLVDELAIVEARIEGIERMLSDLGKPAKLRNIRLEEVRKFVEERASALESLLMGSAETLKIEFQRRISAPIRVMPVETETGRVFHVSGDVALFSRGDGALLYKLDIRFIQQRTIHVDFNIPLNESGARSDKGRSRIFTASQMSELRERVAAGERKPDLAREFGISLKTVYTYFRSSFRPRV